MLWSFAIELVGSSITGNRWVLDTSVLAHLGPVPAAAADWPAIGVLLALGALCALAGLAAFRRRDLVPA